MKDVEIMAKYCRGMSIKYKWSKRSTVDRFFLLLSDSGKYLVKSLPRNDQGEVQWEKLFHIERKRAEKMMGYRR